MSRFSIVFALFAASTTFAQYKGPKLTDRRYTYPGQIPYQVDTESGSSPDDRGPQFGFTQCNSTTEGPKSNCQLAMLNDITDFCIWGPTDPNSLIQDEEARTVAFCTKKGHGARTMPAGTITGLQVLKAPDYVLFSGTIDQVKVNIKDGDTGGEMDPHGADERGNPLGGLVYSNAFSNGNANSFQQVIEWHNFMGSNMFCFKICDPSKAGSATYCNNVFDRTGCNFVAPASYKSGVFESCDSDNQDPVGVYVSNGQTLTYKQPPEPTPVGDLPSIRTPASSNCKQFTSASLFTDAAAASPTSTPSGTASGSNTSNKGTSSASSGANSSGKPSSASGSSSTPGASNAAKGRISSASIGFGPFVAIAVSILLGAFGVVGLENKF